MNICERLSFTNSTAAKLYSSDGKRWNAHISIDPA